MAREQARRSSSDVDRVTAQEAASRSLVTFQQLEGLRLASAQEGARELEPRLTIGQVAKTSRVAAKTIRYYEQIGVLPAPRRGTSGYRLYDEPGVERLRFIHRARSLGLPLQHLKTLMNTLNGGPHPPLRPRLRALIREQLEGVKTQIAELELLRQQLEQIVERMRAPAPRRAGGACQCLDIMNAPARQRRREARLSSSSAPSP